ncbi:MAG: 30S ribosomal protein S20 [Candidatus Zixiibacteriota bacterium]
MPNLRKNLSAEKRVRQAAKRRARNRIVRGQMRRLIADFRAEEDSKKLEEMLPQLFSAIDKAAKKGVIHKNTASRYKSRLAKRIQRIKENAE